ncbi:MAG TPA: DUF1385 domain-containing protein, partial [Chloroflexota bacterium]|nr:DUF1385 domain-containing protein [Chloroflexota bacterium]
QAVIEGVMMRGARHYAVAVRDPRGQIVVHHEPLRSTASLSRVARLPLIRGMVALWSTLSLGMRALAFAASVAMVDEEEGAAPADKKANTSPLIGGSMAIALIFAVGLFFLVPLLLTNLVGHQISSPLVSNLVENGLRLALILGYMIAIGRLAEVQRVFGYHGAEHKTINAYEAGVELTVPNVRRFSLIHPRCGTTFLLVVVVVSFFVFLLLGRPPLVGLIVSRVVLIPIIAGLAFELIRLGATNYKHDFVRTLLAPGLALQRLTTREPNDTMIEVAIAALHRVLAEEGAPVPL